MLWSLIKILVFVAIVAAASLGAMQLMSMAGGIQITFAGTEITLSPLQAALALVALLGILWLALKLAGFLVAVFRFIIGDDTAMSRYFDRNRERRGFRALADGMLALASGEGNTALVQAARAERYLKRSELTNLLTAQAAEMAGDQVKAEKAYKDLIRHDKTRFVGVRGIMQQKLADGDTDTAMKLAQKAFALKPAHSDTQDVLLRLQAADQDWSGARKTLAAKLKHGQVPRDLHRRRDAVLALSEAQEAADRGDDTLAHDRAIEANRLSPDLVPAAVMTAQQYIQDGKPKYAARVLLKSWESQPHPDLAAAFAAIAPNETPKERQARFGALTRIQADHPETHMLEAELAIAAEDFPGARRKLGDLVETAPTSRVMTLMAAIEKGMGADDAVVRGWLTKALTASRGPQWVCDNCNSVQAQWTPVCANCGGFDTLSWRELPAQDVSIGGAEMLPLIVGEAEENLPVVAEVVAASPDQDTTTP